MSAAHSLHINKRNVLGIFRSSTVAPDSVSTSCDAQPTLWATLGRGPTNPLYLKSLGADMTGAVLLRGLQPKHRIHTAMLAVSALSMQNAPLTEGGGIVVLDLHQCAAVPGMAVSTDG